MDRHNRTDLQTMEVKQPWFVFFRTNMAESTLSSEGQDEHVL